MDSFVIDLKKEYKSLSGDKAILTGYTREFISTIGKTKKRKAMIVVAGGAYQFVSARETEPVAVKFLGEGYNVFVLDYSVAPNTYPEQIMELAAAVCHIKRNAEKYLVDTDKIAICGFSAGGHLCANFTIERKKAATLIGEDEDAAKIAACVLGYPVITSGRFAHRFSFENLSGKDGKLAERLSLENCDLRDVCPTFIWTTATDNSVPAENSLLYATALSKGGVPYELHVFSDGPHGMGVCEFETANEEAEFSQVNSHARQWVALSLEWLNRVLNTSSVTRDGKYNLT